jgi:NAD(P)-dependent dehydrogenase (short-subunit alcohol dehydrogenase family)
VNLLDRHYRRLRGRTAWILGGRRIGRVVARALAEQGVHLILSYRSSRKEAETSAVEARRLGVKAITVHVDAGESLSVNKAIPVIRSRFPRIDILINMASVFEKIALEKITPEHWQDNFAAHVLGSFWPARAALRMMPRGAHIINIADRTSIGPMYTDYLPYVVTKGAVDHLTRAMAKELAPRGIVVNAIAPGPVQPPDDVPARVVNAWRAASPLKIKITTREAVEQFALLVLYLSTETLASGFTYPLDQGQNL